MTPEQREELKQAAQDLHEADDHTWPTFQARFRRLVGPAAILSLIAQVEALTVPQVEMTATSGAELSAAVKRIQRQNMQGMADCMDMVHRELIEAGIIDNGTPPMMITNAVCAYIARMRSSLSNSPEIKGIAQTGWKLVPVELTDDMLVAFAEVWYSKARPIDDCEMADCYAAMLDAAPTIPAIPGTKEGA